MTLDQILVLGRKKIRKKKRGKETFFYINVSVYNVTFDVYLSNLGSNRTWQPMYIRIILWAQTVPQVRKVADKGQWTERIFPQK